MFLTSNCLAGLALGTSSETCRGCGDWTMGSIQEKQPTKNHGEKFDTSPHSFRPKCNLISMMKGLVNGPPNDFVRMSVQCSSNQTQPHTLGATKDHQVPNFQTTSGAWLLGSESYQGPTFFCVFFRKFIFMKDILSKNPRTTGIPNTKNSFNPIRFLGVFLLFQKVITATTCFQDEVWTLASWNMWPGGFAQTKLGVPPSGWFPGKKSNYLPYGCYIQVLVYTLWFMIYECDLVYKHNVHDVQYTLYPYTSSI